MHAKLLIVLPAVASGFHLGTTQTTSLTIFKSVAPPRSAPELLEKAAHCVGGECELEEIVHLKEDLTDTLKSYDSTISTYADVPEPDELSSADHHGSEVEDHALRKYIAKMRQLHSAISDKLNELDALLVKIKGCRESKKSVLAK